MSTVLVIALGVALAALSRSIQHSLDLADKYGPLKKAHAAALAALAALILLDIGAGVVILWFLLSGGPGTWGAA